MVKCEISTIKSVHAIREYGFKIKNNVLDLDNYYVFLVQDRSLKGAVAHMK